MRSKHLVLKSHFKDMKARRKAKIQDTERSKEMTKASRENVMEVVFGVWR